MVFVIKRSEQGNKLAKPVLKCGFYTDCDSGPDYGY